MPYDYTVITYGGGRILTEIFNGIAAAVGSTSYMTLIGIASLFAFAWVALESAFKQNFQMNIRWFAGFFLMYNILLVPKVTVHIEDKINQTEVNVVQNVPWGLAEFSSDITQLFYEITKLAETVYTLPDDLRYAKSGTVMASSLVESANRFTITNPQFANNMTHFMQQCVFYDLLLGKYTTQDLFTTNNLWSFISDHASPARAFKYNSTIVTCQQGVQQLTKDWQQELQQASFIYGSRFFVNNTQSPDKELLQYLPISYGYLTGISETAQAIMQQNMVKNAIQQAVITNAGKVNANAALQSYAFARSQQTKRALYQVAGQQAGYWLPIMKIVFEAILLGAFLFLVPLMLLPFGFQIFKTYIFALVWVESWAPLYAILNLVMTFSAKLASTAATSTKTAHVLSMMTLPGLAQTNYDISYLAGYFSLSIPVIAYYITRGGAMGFMALSQYMGGAIQSAGSQAVQETTTGNLSVGNTSFGNHSAFNTNANHFDTNARVFSGAYNTQMAGGSQLTITPNGAAILDNRGAISSLGTSVNLAESIRSAYTHQADRAWSNMVSDAHAYSQSMSSALRGMDELGSSQSQTHASGDSANVSHQGSFQTAANEIHQLTSRFAQSHGISHQNASRVLAAAYINAHGGFNANRSLAGKLFGAVTGLSGGVTVGTKGEGDLSHQSTNQHLMDDAKDFLNNSNFSNAVDQATRAAKDHSFRSNNEEGQRFGQSIASSFDQAEQARQDMQSQYQQSESFRNMASYAKDNSLSINANASQPFLDWMKNQSAPGSHGPMGMDSVEYIMANRPGLAQEYAQRWSQQEASQLANNFSQQSGGMSSSSVQSDFQSNNSNVPSDGSVRGHQTSHDNTVLSKAHSQGLGAGSIVDHSAEQQADDVLHQAQQSIAEREHSVSGQGHNIQSENEKQLKD